MKRKISDFCAFAFVGGGSVAVVTAVIRLVQITLGTTAPQLVEMVHLVAVLVCFVALDAIILLNRLGNKQC